MTMTTAEGIAPLGDTHVAFPFRLVYHTLFDKEVKYEYFLTNGTAHQAKRRLGPNKRGRVQYWHYGEQRWIG